MRTHRLLILAAAATAACSDAPSPTAPRAPTLAPSLAVFSYTTPPVAPAGCPTTRTYYLDEVTPYAVAITALVTGAAGPATSVASMSVDFELLMDPVIVADLQASANAGCTANIQFHTYGSTYTAGVATSEFEGHVRAAAQRAGSGTWGFLGRVDQAWAQPPAPGSCASFSCWISLHHLIEVGPGIHANLASGDLLRVEAIGRARADAVGVAPTDSAQASFSIDAGNGINLYGPRLVIYLP
jgi:hypothetical protein